MAMIHPKQDDDAADLSGRWRDSTARGRSLFASLRLAARVVQVRLRFPLVLLFAFLVVGNWDWFRGHWDKITRGALGTPEVVSIETEYWCPMCPGVVSDWPGKCPVCNMALVQRRRGEAVPLPDGVLARMQLSPYRMQLAGVQTTPVEYRPLTRELVLAGLLAPGSADDGRPAPLCLKADVLARDLPVLENADTVQISTDALAGHEPFAGSLPRPVARPANGAGMFSTCVEVSDPAGELRSGMFVRARIAVPLDRLEPFRSLPVGAPPLRAGEPRAVFVCPDHPDAIHAEAGRCLGDQKPLESRPLAPDERLRWWCPMHPHVSADKPGAECPDCHGMKLMPRVVAFRPAGQVLCVPESALLDTGAARVGYVERAPGMFEAVEVVVGPRSGNFYPVVRGLAQGQRVVSAGAFLVDAETRLRPGAATAYFGAAQPSGAREQVRPDAPTALDKGLEELTPADRALAARQKICPVTGEPLGSMGTPVRVVVEGRIVFLCCDGCKKRLRKEPAKYLAKLHD
jgi:hypothetical protein